MADRLGGSLAGWGAEPWAFVLWCFYHLRELDHRSDWRDRMHRIDSAQLGAIGFHEPGRLQDERQKAIASAAHTPNSLAEARARGARLAALIETANVFGDPLAGRMVS